MKRKISLLIITIILISYIGTNAIALDGGGLFDPAPSESINESVDDDEKEDSEAKGIITTLKELIDTIDYWREKGGWYYVFASAVGVMFDEALSAVEGVYGTAYLYTPPLTGEDGHNWVYKGWNTVFVGTIGIIAITLLITVKKMWHGDIAGMNKTLKSIGIIFLSAVISFFSLYIIESGLYLQNETFNKISQNQIKELYPDEKYMSLQDIPGDLVLKAAFANSDMDVEALSSMSMSQVFLDDMGSKAGGLIGMMIGEGTLILLGLLAIMRSMALKFLTIAAAAYINGAALTGEIKVNLGYSNIIVRTALLQAFFNISWFLMIGIKKVPDAAIDMGISPTFFNIIILLMTFILAIIFWLKPFVKAIKDPLTLGGDQVLKGLGKVTVGFGKGVEIVSNNLGWASTKVGWVDGERAGIKASEAGKRIQSFGDRFSKGEASMMLTEQMDRFKHKLGLSRRIDEKFSVISQEPEIVLEDIKRQYQSIKLPEEAVNFREKLLQRYPELESDYLLDKDKESLLIDTDSIAKVKSFAEEIYGHERVRIIPENIIVSSKMQFRAIKVPESRRRAVIESIKNVPREHIVEGKEKGQILINPKSYKKAKIEIEQYFKDKIPYWEHGGRYIVYQKGLPVLMDIPPKGGVLMGKWK